MWNSLNHCLVTLNFLWSHLAGPQTMFVLTSQFRCPQTEVIKLYLQQARKRVSVRFCTPHWGHQGQYHGTLHYCAWSVFHQAGCYLYKPHDPRPNEHKCSYCSQYTQENHYLLWTTIQSDTGQLLLSLHFYTRQLLSSQGIMSNSMPRFKYKSRLNSKPMQAGWWTSGQIAKREVWVSQAYGTMGTVI